MIVDCWANENENYITNPVMIEFCRDNNIKSQIMRRDLLKAINDFSALNEENKNKVADWLEIIMKQGIKNVLFREINIPMEVIKELKKNAKNLISEKFPECVNRKLYSNITKGTKMNLQSINIEKKDDNIGKISFTFTIYLYELKKEVRSKIIYPIFVDIDLNTSIISGRAKSKSNIFRVNSKDENELGNKTTTDQLIKECIIFIEEKMGAVEINKEKYIYDVKKAIYKILEKYTFTPETIKNKIDSMDGYIDDFINKTLEMLEVNNTLNFNKAKEDIKIFIEKYISINVENKDIFINDREAYPYKLIATDSEFTRVEETTTSFEPLQCKEKFFDNKKSIKYEGTCDGIFLIYARKDKGYFPNNIYKVKISTKKDFCCVRFESYVTEEDINNVLSSIIESR